MIKENIVYVFLTSFFSLFNAYVDKYRINDKSVSGSIVWKDYNDKQAFFWKVKLDEVILSQIALLCDFLMKHNLITNDRITIAENELKARLSELGWDESLAQKNICYLCSVEIKMVDDGIETDSFFIHF